MRTFAGHRTPSKSPVSRVNVGVGRHRLLVAARDAAGNLDPTPAKSKFNVLP